MKTTIATIASVAAFCLAAGFLWPHKATDDATTHSARSPDRPALAHAQVRQPPLLRLRAQSNEGSTDPTAQNYEPLLLKKREGWTVREIFENEPVNPVFAKPREEFLADRIESLLADRFPGASIKNVECRTSSCSIALTADKGSVKDLYRFVQRFSWGNSMSPERSADGVDLKVVFDSTLRDHGVYAEGFERIIVERRSLDDDFWDEHWKSVEEQP